MVGHTITAVVAKQIKQLNARPILSSASMQELNDALATSPSEQLLYTVGKAHRCASMASARTTVGLKQPCTISDPKLNIQY